MIHCLVRRQSGLLSVVRTAKQVVTSDRLLTSSPRFGGKVEWKASLVKENVRTIDLNFECPAGVWIGAMQISAEGLQAVFLTY